MALPLLKNDDFRSRAVSPLQELGAYEWLWLQSGASFKSIADKFRSAPDSLPSDFAPTGEALEHGHRVWRKLREAGIERFGVRVHGAGEYPQKLRDADHPIELLYYTGWWDLVETPGVSVVGTRNPTTDGLARTRRVAKMLVENGYTVVSGLAKGVDAMAHRTAMEMGGRTIAVIGTPLNHNYPKENAGLQREIAEQFLLISQVPVLRYEAANPTINRFFFPERNVTMSALTMATVIIEAGDTSGTLHQARAALKQGRKLFILDSLFHRSDLTWPHRYLEQGAIRVRDFGDILAHLPDVRGN